MLRHAVALLDDLPRTSERILRTIRLHLALGSSLTPEHGLGATGLEAIYVRARELSEELDDSVQLFQCLTALTGTYVAQARLDRASECAERLDALAAAMPLPTFAFVSDLFGGSVAYHAGPLGEARRRLERAVALTDISLPPLSLDFQVLARIYLSFALLHMGMPDQARASMRAARAWANQQHRPFDRAAVAQFECSLHMLLRDEVGLVDCVEEACELGQTFGFPAVVAMGRFARSRLSAKNGDHDAALATMAEAIASYRETGQHVVLPLMMAGLAEAQLAAGANDAAAATLAETNGAIESTGEVRLLAEVQRLEGDVHLAIGDSAAARVFYGRAIEVARQQGARWWELRATTSWAQLHRTSTMDAASRQQACSALAAIVASFDEGHDTADWIAARATLQELR